MALLSGFSVERFGLIPSGVCAVQRFYFAKCNMKHSVACAPNNPSVSQCCLMFNNIGY